jgi:hypothetical protein
MMKRGFRRAAACFSGFNWQRGKGVGDMTEEENKQEQTEAQDDKKEKDEGLPFCTTAPSAEHSRGPEEDDPCDDGRSGP